MNEPVSRRRRSLTGAEYDALPEVLTSAQAALILGTSEVQMRRWAVRGVVPGRRLGQTWRYSKSRLERLAREGELPRESDDPQ